MSWVVAGTTLVVGAYQASEAEDAEDAQFAANNRAMDEQRAARLDFNERTDPFRELGLSAAPALLELLGLPQSIEGPPQRHEQGDCRS